MERVIARAWREEARLVLLVWSSGLRGRGVSRGFGGNSWGGFALFTRLEVAVSSPVRGAGD